MSIFVRKLDGKSVAIDAVDTDLVNKVKVQLCVATGIAVEDQRLIFGGYQLMDGRALADYGIRNGSTLHLVLRLRGGGVGGTIGRSLAELAIKSSSRGSCLRRTLLPPKSMITEAIPAPRRLFGTSADDFLGYFYRPGRVIPHSYRRGELIPSKFLEADVRFEPSECTSQSFSLQFLPGGDPGLTIYDSYKGLLLLAGHSHSGLWRMLVCDPVTGRYAFTRAPLTSTARFVGAAIHSRENDDFTFHAVWITVEPKRVGSHTVEYPFARVASYRNGKYTWWDHIRYTDVTFGEGAAQFLAGPPLLGHPRDAIHATGRIYWHTPFLGSYNATLVLDCERLRFSLLEVPSPGYRPLGETAEGRLCAATLSDGHLKMYSHLQGFQNYDGPIGLESPIARDYRDKPDNYWLPEEGWNKPGHNWVYEEHDISHAVDKLKDNCPCIVGLGPACTSDLFIRSTWHYKYNMLTKKMTRLTTHDGLEWGTPVFPYFH